MAATSHGKKRKQQQLLGATNKRKKPPLLQHSQSSVEKARALLLAKTSKQAQVGSNKRGNGNQRQSKAPVENEVSIMDEDGGKGGSDDESTSGDDGDELQGNDDDESHDDDIKEAEDLAAMPKHAPCLEKDKARGMSDNLENFNDLTMLACDNVASVSSITQTLSSGTNQSTARSGIVDMQKAIADRIVNVVNQKVYPYMKFITNELEMEHDFPSFGKKIMDEMNVDKNNRREWWHAYKRIAKLALQQKRSSVGAAVKKAVIGLIQKGLVDAADWIQHVMSMRENSEGAYGLFYEHVLSHVVGRDVWKRRSSTHTVGQIATISDEAFALFLLENSWDTWVKLATDKEPTNVPSPKYSTRGPGTKKFQGWSETGIVRFNELFDDVEEDRENDKGGFDEKFKNAKRAAIMGKAKPTKVVTPVDPNQKVVRARIEQPRKELAEVRAKKKNQK